MPTDELLSQVAVETQSVWGFPVPLTLLKQHVFLHHIEDERIARWATDIGLAVACAAAFPAALECLEREYLAQVPIYIARVRLQVDEIEEVIQQIRVRMLVGSPPGIGSYAATGPLGAFLRVTAVRIALNVAQRGSDAANSEEEYYNLASMALDAEGLLNQDQHRSVVQAALDKALLELSDRDRTLLRFYFVEELSVDAIGKIYSIHRSTAARWIVDLRSRLFARVRSSIDVNANTGSIVGIFDLVRSQIQISLG